MSQADVIFCPLGDYQVMYGAATEDEAIDALASKYPNALIVMTLGADGAQARRSQRRHPAPTGDSGR